MNEDWLRPEVTSQGAGAEAKARLIAAYGEPQRRYHDMTHIADGLAQLRAVEGLTDGESLHKLQSLFAKHRALQCGFCTPGMIMSSYELLKNNSNPTELEIRHGLAGNICRCNGYHNIIRAVQYAAEKGSRYPNPGCISERRVA